jgi:hypothetical protein
MVVSELAAVVLVALLIQELACSRVMQLPVVKHHQAGMSHEIRPHVVVTWRVTHVEHGEIVRLTAVLPDEVMRIEHANPRVGRGKPTRISVDEQIDLMRSRELGQQLAVVLGNP